MHSDTYRGPREFVLHLRWTTLPGGAAPEAPPGWAPAPTPKNCTEVSTLIMLMIEGRMQTQWQHSSVQSGLSPYMPISGDKLHDRPDLPRATPFLAPNRAAERPRPRRGAAEAEAQKGGPLCSLQRQWASAKRQKPAHAFSTVGAPRGAPALCCVSAARGLPRALASKFSLGRRAAAIAPPITRRPGGERPRSSGLPAALELLAAEGDLPRGRHARPQCCSHLGRPAPGSAQALTRGIGDRSCGRAAARGPRSPRGFSCPSRTSTRRSSSTAHSAPPAAPVSRSLPAALAPRPVPPPS